MIIDKDKLRDAGELILEALGEDKQREGLVETPNRFSRFMVEFFTPKPFKFTTFSAEGNKDLVIVKNIHFYSFCEHHILPVIGECAIGYVPNETIGGLSKLARTVELFAGRLQNQERMTAQILEHIEKNLKPLGVAVHIEARHLCMELRGVKKPTSSTITNKFSGIFKMNDDLRKEFLSSI